MYTAFYGLREKPFTLSPDPRYLFLSDTHREVLGHLIYGIEENEGFIAISGEVGTGKTTLCRTLLDRLGSDAEVAFLFNPHLGPAEVASKTRAHRARTATAASEATSTERDRARAEARSANGATARRTWATTLTGAGRSLPGCS